MPRFRINHVGLVVPAIETFLQRTSVVFGDYDQRGPLTNERQRVREHFLSDGKSAIELLEPTGDQSPLRAVLAKQPHGGLVHVAFDVDDFDAGLEGLLKAGGKLVTRPQPDVAFDDRRIAFVLLAGLLWEVIERPR